MKNYNYPTKSDMYNLSSIIDYDKLIKIQSGGFEKRNIKDKEKVKVKSLTSKKWK